MGRELDAQVAEKVMGWKLFTWEQQLHDGNTPRPHGLLMPEGILVFRRSGDNGWWSPSMFVKDSFEVVEKMRSDGYSCTMNLYVRDYGKSNVVEFHCPYGPCPAHGNKRTNNHGSGEVDQKTLEVAICLAALQAISERSGG